MFKVQAFALLSYIVQQPGSALGEGYRAEDVAGSPSDSNSLFSKKHLVPMRDVTLQAGPFDRNNLKSLPATAALLEVLAVPDAPSAAGGRGPPQIPTALLEGALENLAKETLKGTSDVSNATRASLAAIISAMDDIIADGLRLHIEDQWEVDQAREEISNCSVDTSQNKDYASRTEAAEDSHDTCRENQSVTRKHKLQKCSAYEDYVASASPLQVCPVSTPTTPAELEAVLEWAQGYRGEYWTYKASCETTTEEYDNQTNTCYTQQAAFENAFCEYHMQLTGSCDSYASCYSRTTNHFAEVTRSVNTSAILRKHEHMSAKKVQCFVKVLNASDEVQGAMLENCLVDFVVDDSMLDIMFPQIPEEIVCSTAPVADPPCTGGFLSSHYAGKVWYDGATTGSCHVCPHLTSPTAITTPAPTPGLPTPAPTQALTCPGPSETEEGEHWTLVSVQGETWAVYPKLGFHGGPVHEVAGCEGNREDCVSKAYDQCSAAPTCAGFEVRPDNGNLVVLMFGEEAYVKYRPDNQLYMRCSKTLVGVKP